MLTVKEIPIPLGFSHPKSKYDQLPNHEFSMGIIAPKGSGKTTLIANLLGFYKNYFHSIIIFSPTVASDEKWDWVKSQDLLIENKPLQQWIKYMSSRNPSGTVVQERTPGMELQGLVNPDREFSPKIPEKNFYSEYDPATLGGLLEEQMKMVKTLKKYKKSKHLANRLLIIFDDLVGSQLFSNARENVFKKLNTNHRHYSASLIMVSQAYKELPKTVRSQLCCLIVFEIANEKEVEVIYEENPMALTRKDWQEIYQYATYNDHDFLFINYKKPKRLRIMKNFDQVLFIGS